MLLSRSWDCSFQVKHRTANGLMGELARSHFKKLGYHPYILREAIMIRGKILLAAGLLLFAGTATSVLAQSDPIEIPRPTGEFGVGTVVWDWADSKRPDELTAD